MTHQCRGAEILRQMYSNITVAQNLLGLVDHLICKSPFSNSYNIMFAKIQLEDNGVSTILLGTVP